MVKHFDSFFDGVNRRIILEYLYNFFDYKVDVNGKVAQNWQEEAAEQLKIKMSELSMTAIDDFIVEQLLAIGQHYSVIIVSKLLQRICYGLVCV